MQARTHTQHNLKKEITQPQEPINQLLSFLTTVPHCFLT